VNRRRLARVVLEALAAALSLAAGAITVVVPDWLERTFGIHPDSGRGEAEWVVVGSLFVVAALLGFDALGALRHMGRSRPKSTARQVISDAEIPKWRRSS
jgi:hypothetical protein